VRTAAAIEGCASDRVGSQKPCGVVPILREESKPEAGICLPERRRRREMDTPQIDSPIVRLTRLVADEVKRGGHRRPQSTGWTVYGVDGAGVERVYARHATEEEHLAWRAGDPLWRQDREILIHEQAPGPTARDVVLEINIAAALEAGEKEMALALAGALSPAARARLARVPSAKAAGGRVANVQSADWIPGETSGAEGPTARR
jgi:hypothetical protein